jgi:hypothetical protein
MRGQRGIAGPSAKTKLHNAAYYAWPDSMCFGTIKKEMSRAVLFDIFL